MALNTQTYFGTDGVLLVSDPKDFEQDSFTLLFGDSGQLARVTNVSVYVTTEVVAFHQLGSRAPKELRAGNITISGTVERAYINGALMRLMLGQYAENEEVAGYAIPAFNMKLILDNLVPAGDEGNSILTLYGVMFDTWQVHLPENDFMMEKLGFKALRIAVTDSEIST
jgi:hypothetical protein